MDFSDKREWRQRDFGAWMHEDDCVATYEILKETKQHWKFKYHENKGDLVPAKDYSPRADRLILRDYMGAIIKAGNSHLMFYRLYQALKTLGRFSLKELYFKEQEIADEPIAFYYKDTWFIIAPVRNPDNDIKKGQVKLLTRGKT